MPETPTPHLRFFTGSQHLYGPATLAQVARNSRTLVDGLNAQAGLAAPLRWLPTLTSSAEIEAAVLEAEADPSCAGIVCWMHTFSPAKLWIAGLSRLSKPLLHLHTQFNAGLPWADIDMAYMNLHQSAHGDREFGHVCARLGLRRKVLAGHWRDAGLQARLAAWTRVALGLRASRGLKVARFGDNMREVAVTDGDKVEAQRRLGWSVNSFGVSELAERCRAVEAGRVEALVADYGRLYTVVAENPAAQASVREAARQELAIGDFLREGGFDAFTTTFEDLGGLHQLPGLAAQRLMEQGYGFGAEGDWKTAALLRCFKEMTRGLEGGASFMEDYTYDFSVPGGLVLGAHMLEVCPSLAAQRPRLEVHPLSIGGKADPARLVFEGRPGPAVNASLIDMGTHFRLLGNAVQAVPAPAPMPKLPVAHVLWRPLPDLSQSAEAWIRAGGAHHTAYSPALSLEQLADFAAGLGLEWIAIGG